MPIFLNRIMQLKEPPHTWATFVILIGPKSLKKCPIRSHRILAKPKIGPIAFLPDLLELDDGELVQLGQPDARRRTHAHQPLAR